MMHRKSIGWMLRASMGLWLLRRPEKKETQDQRWPGWTNQKPSDAYFSLELKNSNFRSGGNLLSFNMDKSFYSEFWSGYLFSNFLNVDGN